MRLYEAHSGQLWLVNDEDHQRCAVCREWFFRGWFPGGSYCGICWRHYCRWRNQMVRHEKVNGYRLFVDYSVRTFREKYMSGLLTPMVPWTWLPPGETEVPPGALT